MRGIKSLIISIFVYTLALGASVGVADTETYDLESLIGSYTELSPTKTDTLSYHGPGGKVTSAFLHIVGTVNKSQFFCWGYTFYYGADLETDLHHIASSIEWLGSWVNLAGSIDTTAYYYGDEGEVLTLSEGDVIEIGVTLEQYVSSCALLTPSSVSIQSAFLTINIDTISPAKQSTWGRIKALYTE